MGEAVDIQKGKIRGNLSKGKNIYEKGEQFLATFSYETCYRRFKDGLDESILSVKKG